MTVGVKMVGVEIIQTLINTLKKTDFEDNQFKDSVQDLAYFGCDHSKHFTPNASLIIFPKSTKQVQAIVKACNELNLVIVPSGGRTGLSAAAVAANGEVVISFDKMNQILHFYPDDRMVEVQAGVITKTLQEFALDNGLYYPVDFASSGSSQIGGNISTNAGGIKVIRYGMTRNWVASLTVVTGNGDILDLNKGMIKNATGYDFRHLFVGAEGTLGLITQAQIYLTRPPKDLTVMVLGVDEFSAIMQILSAFRQHIDLTAFEFFDKVAMSKLLAAQKVTRPFESDCAFYALLEFEAPFAEIIDTAMAVFEDCMQRGLIVDGVMSQSITQAMELWKLREYISETISHFTPYKNDLSVLVSHIPQFIADIDEIVAKYYPDFEVCWFGHIGDGNLHLNILKPEHLSQETFFGQCQIVNQYVFEVVKKYYGSISAEHGVGMTKKPYLAYTRSDTEIAYMKAIKSVFDSKGLINKGKIFD